MTRRNPTPRKRLSNAGRKLLFGEPTVKVTARVPQSLIEILEMIGGSRGEALIRLAMQSTQYRLQFGSVEPEGCD